MNIFAYIAAYLGVGYLLLAWGAIMDVELSARATLVQCLLWPLVLFVLVPVVFLMETLARRGFRVNIEIRRDLSFCGTRRPSNPRTIAGLAVRFAWVEVQMWRVSTL